MNTLFMAAMVIEAIFALGFISISGVMMGLIPGPFLIRGYPLP